MTYREREYRNAPLGGVDRKTGRVLADMLAEVLRDPKSLTRLTDNRQTERDVARVLGMQRWSDVERGFEELGETPKGQETIMFIYDGLVGVSQSPREFGLITGFKVQGPMDYVNRLAEMCILNHPDLTRIYSQPPLTGDRYHRGYDPSVAEVKCRLLESGTPGERIGVCDEFAIEGRFNEITPLTKVLGDNREGADDEANKVVAERAARAIEHISWSMSGSVDSIRDEEVDALIDGLNNRNPVVRRHITYALGYFTIPANRQKQVDQTLEKMQQDHDNEVQAAATKAQTLTKIRRQQAKKQE